MPNAMGISEGLLGRLATDPQSHRPGPHPEFALSEAEHNKRRETVSPYELIKAMPRWSGGRNQTSTAS